MAARVVRVGWWLALAGLALMAAVPTRWWEQAPTVCLFRRLWGVSCLGCGLTRSVSALLHGDPVQAAAFNPLGLVVAPCVILALAIGLGRRVSLRRSSCKC